jgi:tetratricopeptide (TPR) repeat protein
MVSKRLKRFPPCRILQKRNEYVILGLCLLTLTLVIQGSSLCGRAYLSLGMLSLSRASATGLLDNPGKQSLYWSEHFLTKATRYAQVNQAAKWGLGLVLLARGDRENAIATWREISVPVGRLLTFGEHAEEARNWEAALTWYKVAAEFDFPEAATALGGVLNRQKNYKTAITVWQCALDNFADHPQRLSWWRGLVESLRASEQWDATVRTARDALSEFPNDPILLTELGRSLYHSEGDLDVATESIRQAIDLDGSQAEAYAAIGRIMMDEKRYEEAYAWYSEAVVHDPSVKWWHVARANMARFMGDLSLAIALYEEAIALYPDYATAQFRIAQAYYLSGKVRESVVAIERALELKSSPDAKYYIWAGQIYEQAEQVNKAIDAYQKAYELAPNKEVVQEALQRLEDQ